MFDTISKIISFILQDPSKIEATIAAIIKFFKATTAATPTTVPSTPTSSAVEKKPSEVIRDVQKLLNQFVKPQPPLKEDGWMGDKTEAAIKQGLVMLKPYMGMLG